MRQAGTEVLAISADTITSHERFAASLGGLPFPLLSDTSCQAIAAYDVLNDRGSGPRRSVFVVTTEGILRHVNTHYEVGKPEHLEIVLNAVGATGKEVGA